MKGFKLVRKAMAREEVDRIPWVPFVGVHAGEMLGLTASEYLQSADHIVDGVGLAIDCYQPDGIPVVFDLQIEAEALGCSLAWSDQNPPAVVSHPLSEGVRLEDLEVPCPGDGRIGLVMDATHRLRETYPEIALYGLVTGPFTLALHLLGTDIFMQMLLDPDNTHRLLRFTTDVAKAMAEHYLEAGVDVVAIVDPMTSQIDPQSFDTFVSPYISEINDQIRLMEGLSSFFVCGNARQNIEAMCKTGPDNISIDENIPLDFVRDTALAHDVSFGGNIKLTLALLMGDEDAARRDALECMDIGGKKGFLLAPGCDLAMQTPAENLLAVTELVHDEESQGRLRASEALSAPVAKLDLSSHWSDEKVIIDIITLDSASCAPCQYMVNAVKRAADDFADRVVLKEHRIKEQQGIRMMASLGVRNLPTVVMDGDIEFISRIPPVEQIKARIEEHLDAKQAEAIPA